MDEPKEPAGFAHFIYSKFDSLSLIFMIIVLVGTLVWIDKHGNSDFEKWLEVFTAGFGGAYLTLVTAARQAWGSKNGNPPAAPPAQSIGIIPRTGATK